MSLFKLSGKTSSKNESEEKTLPKARNTTQRQVKELLGREFRMVKNGLDPDEVVAFLEAVAGSSEAALKRLEHFASIQRLSQSMEAMTEESYRMAEHIKEQAKQEAEVEKAQIIEEAKRKAEEMIDQTKKSCLAFTESTNSVLLEAKHRTEEMVDQTKKSCHASVEDTNYVLLEATTKAREMEEMAFQKVKEMVDMSTGVVQQNIHHMVDAIYRDLNSEFERLAKELSTPPVTAVDTASEATVQETVLAKEHLPELAKVEESEKTPDSALKSQPIGIEIEQEEVPINAKTHPVAPKDDNDDNSDLYSGEVILTIPPGVGQSWVRQLEQRLCRNPGVRIPLVGGSDRGGIIMNLSLDEPIALTSILLQMPNVDRVVEDQQVKKYSAGLARILGHRPPEDTQRTTLMVVLNKPSNSDSPVHLD